MFMVVPSGIAKTVQLSIFPLVHEHRLENYLLPGLVFNLCSFTTPLFSNSKTPGVSVRAKEFEFLAYIISNEDHIEKFRPSRH